MSNFIATVTIEGNATSAEAGREDLGASLGEWAYGTAGRVTSVHVGDVVPAPEPERQVHSLEMTAGERAAVERHLATLRG